MKNKKRSRFFPRNHKASHVGIVLSFVIFVVFLTVLYSILESSTKTQKDKQTILDSLEKELIRKFSVEVTSMTISVDKDLPTNQPCIKLENFGATEMGKKISVKDNMGNTQDSYDNLAEDGLQIDRTDEDNRFFKIYNSSEFAEIEKLTISPCQQINEDKYTIGLTRTKKYISRNKILKLINEYDNYETLKEKLDVPQRTEFFFSFEENNRTLNKPEKKIPESVDVYVEKIPIHYMDAKANILHGFVTIKIW